MSKLFSFSLYFISFAPLWVSVLFIDIKSCFENEEDLWTEIISIICIFILTVVCLIVLRLELYAKNKENSSSQKLECATEEKTITAEYLLSYILPLFAFDFTVWNETVLFLIFFCTLGFLCIKHNYFSVNIFLELLNFHFYTCTFKNDDDIETKQSVISHRKLTAHKGETIYLKSLNNEYKLDIDN